MEREKMKIQNISAKMKIPKKINKKAKSHTTKRSQHHVKGRNEIKEDGENENTKPKQKAIQL